MVAETLAGGAWGGAVYAGAKMTTFCCVQHVLNKVLGAVLILVSVSACAGVDAPDGSARVVSGSLVNSPGETLTLEGRTDSGVRLGSGELRADRSFTFAYDETPDPRALVRADAFFCDGLSLEGGAVRTVPDRYIPAFRGGERVGTLAQASSAEFAFGEGASGIIIDRVYADGPARVRGTCTGQNETLDYTLNTGWNTVVAVLEVVSGTPTFSARTAPPPENVRWFYRAR